MLYELYVIEKMWPNTKVLASAVSPEPGAPTYPVSRLRYRHAPRAEDGGREMRGPRVAFPQAL